MIYRSTRGSPKGFTFQEVLLKGYAEDGGLIMPEKIPRVTFEQLKNWKRFSYSEIVFEIAKIYIDESEISHEDLRGLIKNAYSKFSLPEIVKFSKLKDGITVAELYHGPTMAFKDLAMSVFAQLLSHFLNKRNQRAIAIVATSGDTGSAAIASMAGLPNIDVMVMFPRDGCTELQQLQMTTVIDSNVHCYSVEGTSDEEDVVMNKLLCDVEFARENHLTVANSINWARIMVQTATYFYLYLNNVESVGEQLTIVVPTGGAGNLIAGCVAHSMLLPIRLVASVNVNDVVHRFLRDGVLQVAPEVVKSFASAMDIQIPPNLERILFMYSGDVVMAKKCMLDFANDHRVIVPSDVINKIRSVIVDSHSSSDDEIVATMKRCWLTNRYVCCPHTATALAYANHKRGLNVLCVSTASPIKFAEAVAAAEVPFSDGTLGRLRAMATRFKKLDKNDDWEKVLREDILHINASK